MNSAMSRLRATRLWGRLRDLRYLYRNRLRRRFLSEFISRGDLIFDIGANVGHYSLIAKSLGADVVAVEPQAALAAGLRRRFAGSGRIKVLQCAVGPTARTATLHKTADMSEVASLREDAAELSRFAKSHSYSLAETVEVKTVDELIRSNGQPSFCKIDVEGYESSVLAGLGTAIPKISFEFNREYWDDTRRCLELMSNLGSYRFNYALGDVNRLAAPAWLNAAQLENVIGAYRDPLLWGDIYARIDR
jgi:FkbM family methyltransferase